MRLSVASVLAVFCLFLSFLAATAESNEQVLVEFFYYKPKPCTTCPGLKKFYNVYLHNGRVVSNIESDYGSEVSVERISMYSDEGMEKIRQYENLTLTLYDWNSIVVNREVVLKGVDQFINETYLREIIDYYLMRDAVLTVVPVSTSVIVGEIIELDITLENVGMRVESFNIKIYCNMSLIGAWQVAGLSPNQEFSQVFEWNTTDIIPGDYEITVRAESSENGGDIYDEQKYSFTVREQPQPPSTLDGLLSFLRSPLIAVLALALIFGFFETFSPCLIVLLSFVLAYTMGEASNFKRRFLQVMVVGIGFLTASVLVFSALAAGLIVISLMLGIQHILMLAVCVVFMLVGIDLLGFKLFKIFKTKFETKLLIQQLTRRYASTYAGLIILGFLFFFLDPCIAPVFVGMMTSFEPTLIIEFLPLILFAFSLGVMVPFIGVGILTGSISKLTRNTYKHKSKIRAISGLILIGYAVYLIILLLSIM